VTKLFSKKYYNTVRKPHLAQKIVFVDGLEGCGKTLFSSLISAFDRVEKFTYSYEIEHICTLHHLKKIETDAVVTMVRMLTDLILYNTMMSREVNFRPSDLSSVFKHNNALKYIKRLFMKGDYAIPDRILEENPILALTVHKLLVSAKPIFESLQERAVFIEVVRHPLYMITQQSLNNEKLIYTARDFVVYFDYDNNEMPWYAAGWEELFSKSNPIEKSIYYIQKVGELIELSKESLKGKKYVNILTIPFEKFVIDPWPFMENIETILDSKITKNTLNMMKKQKVPRIKYSGGIDLDIYRRCGWEPPKTGLTENEEFQLRREYISLNSSPEAMSVLDRLCADYERKFMGGTIIKNGKYS
jgi:hypothetical protein